MAVSAPLGAFSSTSEASVADTVHSTADSPVAALEALEQHDAALAAFLGAFASHVQAPLSRAEQRRHYTVFMQARVAAGSDRATALAEAKELVRNFKDARGS